MKFLIAAVATLALAITASSGAASYPANLAATATLVSSDGITATVFVQQTSGEPVTLKAWNFCYDGSVSGGSETKSLFGSETLTFNIGPRKYRGAVVIPTWCQTIVYYQVTGNSRIDLAYLYTLGPDA